MNNARLGPGRWGLWLAVALLVGGTAGGCYYRPPSPPSPDKGCKRGVAPADSAQLAACLKGFDFDTAYEAGDEQPLAVITQGPGAPCPDDSTKSHSCRYGPIARIEPVIGAQKYSNKELSEGRFIARITVPSNQVEGYEKYGLVPGGVTYWWVKTNPDGTGGDSYFITRGVDGRVSPKHRNLVREPYEGINKDSTVKYDKARIQRAIMRWFWSLEDETAKGSCGSATCH
jgi:hypothetical protein